MSQPLAVAMLLAVSVHARSDNSLANLLGLSSLDSMYLSLEQKNEGSETPQNSLPDETDAANSIDGNALSYTKYTFYDGYHGLAPHENAFFDDSSEDSSSGFSSSSEDDSSSSSEDGNEMAFGVPIYREMADPHNPHHDAYLKHLRYQDAFKKNGGKKKKKNKQSRQRETITSDEDILHEYGDSKRGHTDFGDDLSLRFGGHGRHGGHGHYSDMMRFSPSAFHYETGGHHRGRHSRHRPHYDDYDYDDYDYDDDESDEMEDGIKYARDHDPKPSRSRNERRKPNQDEIPAGRKDKYERDSKRESHKKVIPSAPSSKKASH